ncbi:MAG: ATP-dependent Clp protease ATP-binding subunit ClpX [Eubacterium sp.]|nr:ATP-dependent Clp protease ATP-binding subunit ClpX [Eubacterium sp.]
MSENKDNFEEIKDENIDETDAKDSSDTTVENTETSDKNSDSNNESEFEKVCLVCRRPESKCGKLFDLPGNVTVCEDCLEKSFHSMQNMGMGVSISKEELEKLLNTPGVHMMTPEEIRNEVPNKQKLKKKKEKTDEPLIDINKIPAPHKIKHMLDDYVIGQDHAKKIMSVAVYNHYKRVATNTMDEIEIDKSNMLMIGPTGCGKTYLVRTLARLLDVPLAITDATSLTEAGYIGDDIESVISKLLANADNDVERAETGIVFIDEIDKIAKKDTSRSRDVSGESVQQGMLKLLEGAEVEVPVGATSKNAMVPLATVNTRNILFICGGAFPDLEDIVKERLNKEAAIGFKSDLSDKYDEDPNIIRNVNADDLRKFGMIPEFLGRLPIMFTLDELTEDMLVQILTDPKNAIIAQFQKLLELDEVKLQFTDEALHAIAKKAIERKTGARALRAILEELMLDIMYEIPKDDNIGTVTITEEYINGKGNPKIEMRATHHEEAPDPAPKKEAQA